MSLELPVEGPFILGNTVRYLTDSGELIDQILQRKKSIQVYVPNEDQDQFSLILKSSINSYPEIFNRPSKIVAVADIEGNFNGLTSFLQHNLIIDQNFDWCFGDGHFLLNGDLVDRGPFPMSILWLLYKLEDQAIKAGGQVHVLLGNHDIMNIQGWFDYAHQDYQKKVRAVTERWETDQAFRFLYSRNTEIGKWIRSKNAVVKIGNLLFVHAGLGYEILPYQLSLAQINQIVRQNLDQDFYYAATSDPMINQVMGKRGPIWYRNLAREHDGLPKDSQEQLERVLTYYEAERMIIGHTVVPDICTDYQGKLIKIDILHGQTKYSGDTKGIMVEGDHIYAINDLDEKKILI